MHGRFLWAVKESGQKETRRPVLRSLIICICSTYRRDNSLSFKQIPPCCRVANNDCSLRKGRTSCKRVPLSLGALRDFCRQAKTHITALAVLCRRRRYCNQRSFLFFGSFLFFCLANKRKEMN